MTDNLKNVKDLLLEMYKENTIQYRHIETQRASVTSSLIAIDTLILGLITFDKKLLLVDLPLTILLIILGLIGMIFTLKQYERYNMLLQRSREFRDKLDQMFADGLIEKLKKKADEIHLKNFKNTFKYRHHFWWPVLHSIIALLGVVLLIFEIFKLNG